MAVSCRRKSGRKNCRETGTRRPKSCLDRSRIGRTVEMSGNEKRLHLVSGIIVVILSWLFSEELAGWDLKLSMYLLTAVDSASDDSNVYTMSMKFVRSNLGHRGNRCDS